MALRTGTGVFPPVLGGWGPLTSSRLLEAMPVEAAKDPMSEKARNGELLCHICSMTMAARGHPPTPPARRWLGREETSFLLSRKRLRFVAEEGRGAIFLWSIADKQRCVER